MEQNPTPEQTPSRAPAPKSSLPKHYLTPVLVLFVAMFAGGAWILSESPDATVVSHDGKVTARPLAAPMATKDEVAAQQAFILKQFGGESANAQQRALVARIGEAIITKTEAKDSGRRMRFTLLAEPDNINVFALPTGEVYVTTALVNRMQTEGQLAAALANGTAHAITNHRLDPVNPENAGTPQASVLKYSTDQESAADLRALKIMADAGYSPEAYLGMFKILTEGYHAGANVQFFATHPSADWRLSKVADTIKKMYPEGVPAFLSK